MAETFRFQPQPQPAVGSPWRKAVVSALLYIVLCTFYIVFSGRIAAQVAGSAEQLEFIERVKGVTFILVTGLLFYLISYVRWRTIQRHENTIIAQERALLHSERRAVANLSVAAVAHDLNNLLQTLWVLTNELKLREDQDPRLAELRTEVDGNLQRLSFLARRVTEPGVKAGLKIDPNVDLQLVLGPLLTMAQRHPDIRRCTLKRVGYVTTNLALNRAWLEDALLNLLINAAQAAGPGGRVELRLEETPENVLVEVHDTGPGVAPKLVRDIFDPGYSTKPDGAGLGLLSVKAFAGSCGAVIDVARSPLGGALFRLRIPRENKLAAAG